MNVKVWRVLALLTICIFIISSCVSAVTFTTKTSQINQLDNKELEPTGKVYGNVDEYRPGYQPRPPVRNALVDAGIKQARTGFYGEFAINNLPVGNINITVSKKGYHPTTITNIPVREDYPTSVYFELYKIDSKEKILNEGLSEKQDNQRSNQLITGDYIDIRYCCGQISNVEELYAGYGIVYGHTFKAVDVKCIVNFLDRPIFQHFTNGEKLGISICRIGKLTNNYIHALAIVKLRFT